MKIDDNDISFVIQGPVSSFKGREQGEGITQKSIASIRQLFPKSTIILSTWKGQDTSQLNVDHTLLLDDPGSNDVFNDGEKQTLNNNRQLLSSHQGLLAVTTKYAAKVRTDNLIASRQFVDLYEQYSATKRDGSFCYLNNRVITSSAFFISSHAGLPVYFHKSDLFDFGETADLLKIWPQQPIPELHFHKKPGYKSRHPATEQFLFLHWLSRLTDKELHINSKSNDDAGLGKDFWRKFIANNLIVCEPSMLGLDVTERFYKRGNISLEYDLEDWKYLAGLTGKPLDIKRIYRQYRELESRLLRLFSSKSHAAK
ncbi:WavE lipopolysaccharide synthesis family protein [Vibrio sp. S4M6]|uniref:WavE lipopolysaccharide synthesis family protein n=1 Tax=Vibrio sinus TaxID=2946865 RepID=UPI002029F946|nr:WavE lipopolysaccharide synthesis family protein [Vibrio sinus]MCL9780358.1 WavE lipopolysaccharide synthesis family protein [Vibrio sinus]